MKHISSYIRVQTILDAMGKCKNMISKGMTVNSTKEIKIPRIFLPYIMIQPRCLTKEVWERMQLFWIEWILDMYVLYAKTFSWTFIRFHLRNKISNIALVKANVNIYNALIKAKFIILIDVLNLDIFNDIDSKINHLIGDEMLELDLLLRNMRIFFCLIVQWHI